jgi:hypothetical protein
MYVSLGAHAQQGQLSATMRSGLRRWSAGTSQALDSLAQQLDYVDNINGNIPMIDFLQEFQSLPQAEWENCLRDKIQKILLMRDEDNAMPITVVVNNLRALKDALSSLHRIDIWNSFDIWNPVLWDNDEQRLDVIAELNQWPRQFRSKRHKPPRD